MLKKVQAIFIKKLKILKKFQENSSKKCTLQTMFKEISLKTEKLTGIFFQKRIFKKNVQDNF